MSLDISSFAVKVNSPAFAGQGQRSEKENTRNGLKASPGLNANEEKPDSTETRINTLDSIGTGVRVDYKIDPQTKKIVIHVVDNESGEVVRKIPGEDFIKLAQRIAEFNQKFLDNTI